MKIDALVLTTTALMPGDSITDDVVVENDGTAQLRYAMTTASTPDASGLRDVLTLTVKTVDATDPLHAVRRIRRHVGRQRRGPRCRRGGLREPGAGRPCRGSDARRGANETLCFRVTLPAGTGNAYQGATTTTTFTFDAEQTANNP